MDFMDGTAWKERFLSKSRKKIKQAGRLLMALAVGGCAFSPIEAFATTYSFDNPTSGINATFDENGYNSNTTPKTYENTTTNSILVGNMLSDPNVSQNNFTINGGIYSTISLTSSTIFSQSSTTDDNVVTINGGTIDSVQLSGSNSLTGMLTTGSNNTININGGTVGRVEANTINIYGGTIGSTTDENSGLYAFPSNNSGAGGKINIYNSPDLSNARIAGTNVAETLNIHTKNLTAKNIHDISNINFYLPSSISNGDTVLTLTGYTQGSNIYLTTDLTNTTIRAGVEGNANLSTGDTVTLIKNENGIITDNTTTYGTLSEGVSLDYDLTVEQADNTSIVARVGNVAPGAGANTAGSTSSSSSSSTSTGTASTGSTSSSSPLKAQTSILPTPMLSSSVLALQGTDRLLEWLPPDDFGMEEESSSTEEKESEEMGKATSSGEFSIFANAGFTNLRTKTGSNSYIDSHSGGFDIGAARTLENSRGKLVFAPIIDYGTGSYDSYVNGMHGSGKTKYWAGGIIARQMNHNGFYYEASIRAGRTSVDFASNDFKQGTTPVHESYDVSAPVYAGHIRLGRLYQIDRSSQLHLYGIYAHNHQNGMTAQLATGETYRFGSVDSGRLRIGARLSWMKKKTQKFYSGIAYQYEFSNSASGTYRGYSTESSNLRGSSGMIELGWQVKPTENSPWMVDVGAVGWIGHQKGFSIQAKIKKAF